MGICLSLQPLPQITPMKTDKSNGRHFIVLLRVSDNRQERERDLVRKLLYVQQSVNYTKNKIEKGWN
jgi:hypothetical protein